jgi:hypothetical protein
MSAPKNAPQRIYLQNGCDDPDCYEPHDAEGVTWCADRIEQCDTAYVRADISDALVEALEPFAKFACDSPHVDEPVCHNCRARAAITKARGHG